MMRATFLLTLAMILTNCGTDEGSQSSDLNVDIHPENDTKSGMVKDAEIHLRWKELIPGNVTDGSNHLEFKVEVLMCPNTSKSKYSVKQCKKLKDFKKLVVRYDEEGPVDPDQTMILTEKQISKAAKSVDWWHDTHFGAFRLAFVLTEIDGISFNDRLEQQNETLQDLNQDYGVEITDWSTKASAKVIVEKVVEPTYNRRKGHGDGGVKAQAAPRSYSSYSSSSRSSSSSSSSSKSPFTYGINSNGDFSFGPRLGDSGIYMDFDGNLGIGF